ncbi:MAG TPA: MFS transporter [Actinocrinis sp.]|nr:MFS transporter [Actinocrinis sp.]
MRPAYVQGRIFRSACGPGARLWGMTTVPAADSATPAAPPAAPAAAPAAAPSPALALASAPAAAPSPALALASAPTAAPTAAPAPAPAPPPRTTYREVFAEPRFRLLFVTRTLGILGDSLRITTLSVLIFATTRSPLLSALAFGVGFTPQLLGSMFLGSLSDRLRPRALIAGGYALEGVAVSVIAVFRLPVLVSLLIVGAVAVLTPVFSGASSRLVAELLQGDAYVLGRSLSNMASSGAQLAGLAVGGVVVAVVGVRPALEIGAVLQFAVALAIWWRLPDLEPPKSSQSAQRADNAVLRSSWAANVRLLRDGPVRRLLLAQWLPSAFVAGAESLVVAYSGHRRFAAGTYGLLLACLPIGMLLGDLLVGRFVRPAMRERLVVPLVATLGLPLLVFVTEPTLVESAAALLVCGTGFAYGLGLQRAFLAAVPADSRGQAFGLLGSGNMTAQGVFPALFGLVASVTAIGTAMAAAGLATVVTAGWLAIRGGSVRCGGAADGNALIDV